MRISDWSSDVCSSDLHHHLPHPAREHGGRRRGERGRRIEHQNAAQIVRDQRVEQRPGAIAREQFGIVVAARARSEEHTSELQSLMRISYAVFCLKKKTINRIHKNNRSLNKKKRITNQLT